MELTKKEIRDALEERHSKEVQDKLSKASVVIAGLGGLGSNIAFALARIGVGHLHLIDFDKVDITNLNRQQYFIRHIGMYKTDALKGELLEINPYLDITTDCTCINESNIDILLKENIVCEAFDDPDAKAMLVNFVLEEHPEKFLVAASGMAGCGNSDSIRVRKVTSRFYLCGDEISEVKAGCGLMAPRVAVCAAKQADLITEYIITGQISTKGE